MSFDPQVFDEGVFGSQGFSGCLFDPAIFDSAVFDVCEDAQSVAETFSGGYWPEPRRRTKEELRQSRIDFGVLQEKQETRPEPPSPAAYFDQSAKIVHAIAKAKAESASLRTEIAALEAEAMAEGIRRTRAERASIEHALLLAQQRLTLLSVQEAVLIEEMEVLDVAYFVAVLH